MKNHTILLIGEFPPKVGGIAAHTGRLAQKLMACGYRVYSWNWKKPFRIVEVNCQGLDASRSGSACLVLPTLRFMREHRIVHYHVSAFERSAKFLPFLAPALGRPYVVTVHSGRIADVLPRKSERDRVCIARFLDGASLVILVNEAQRKVLEALPLRKGLSGRSAVLPAFIRPNVTAADLPDAARTFIDEQKQAGRMVAVVTGYGTPVYDWDVITQSVATGALGEYAWIFIQYGGIDEEYWKRVLPELQAVPNSLMLTELSACQAPAVMQASSLLVRPTTTDGDAIALREALGFGLRVLATSVVARPDGCELFGSVDDLVDALRDANELVKTERDWPQAADCSQEIIEIYESLLSDG